VKITGHKTSSMFKRYADLFSDEEKRAQQHAVQSKRREWKKAHADSVVAMPKPGSHPIEGAHNAHT